MNAMVKQWLAQNGAVFNEEGTLAVADTTAAWQGLSERAVLAPLAGFAVLNVSGEDAEAFLQGQLSNDVRELNGANAQFTTYSTAKGRMLANFLMWKDKGEYRLLLPLDLSAAIIKRLRMFVMRSKVSIELADCMPALLSGPLAADALAGAGFAVGADGMGLHAVNGGVVVTLPFPSYLLVLEPDDVSMQWQKLLSYCALGGHDVVNLVFVRSGFAWVVAATQEAFVPQMANMELVSAINFRKGCYPGQEIVARMQYLGKTKRRLYRVEADEGGLLVGDEVFAQGDAEHSLGVVAAVVTLENGKQEALVVMLISAWDNKVCAGRNSVLLHCLTLPYVVPDII
ncbi:CAF17-like 4Fe-4S cluster assembly/insertion protein YgfZ [Craterilacuibacter sinensis]|uniref:Folate-binding protein YgfZ n=1 Tax=Craterilacuibacter sinensis TaxID=2686017 RepID=A0A845BK65_9NEIS|nr:folate-binding protein YgfZ [Craterilacuibacter sinensis]MXR36642.1 hypothetical protein [Craterilacuibacter sinensis]